jgi:hypothetical protein
MQVTRISKRKFSGGDRVRGGESAPADFRNRVGTVITYGPGTGEYTVRLDDDPTRVTYLQSWWIDALVLKQVESGEN